MDMYLCTCTFFPLTSERLLQYLLLCVASTNVQPKVVTVLQTNDLVLSTLNNSFNFDSKFLMLHKKKKKSPIRYILKISGKMK